MVSDSHALKSLTLYLTIVCKIGVINSVLQGLLDSLVGLS